MDTAKPIDRAAYITSPPRSPGYLLAPFGWAAEPLLSLAQAEPVLISHVVELTRPRMHAIALASPQGARVLCRGVQGMAS